MRKSNIKLTMCKKNEIAHQQPIKSSLSFNHFFFQCFTLQILPMSLLLVSHSCPRVRALPLRQWDLAWSSRQVLSLLLHHLTIAKSHYLWVGERIIVPINRLLAGKLMGPPNVLDFDPTRFLSTPAANLLELFSLRVRTI